MTTAVPLSEVCEITMGQAPRGESYNTDGEGLPLIAGAGDFGDLYPASKKYTTEASKVCERGDVVLGIRATIGEKVIADGRYCLGRGVAGLRPRSGLDGRYLWHWLTHINPLLVSKARGATFLQVNRSDIGELPIALPSLPEQSRIAAILDKADALRTKRREALAQLDRLAQSIFVEMFGDPVSGAPAWPVKALSDCCEAINDCPHSTPTWTDSGCVCLRTSNLTEGDWNWDDKRFVSEDEYHERSKRGYIKPGDIVLSREGTVGVAAIVQPGMEVCMGQRLVQVRCMASSILPEYLLHHFLHVLQPSRISRLMVGSTAQHLNVRELRALPTPLPPLALQQQFAKRIQRIKTLNAQHRESIASANALFASIGELAFRGSL